MRAGDVLPGTLVVLSDGLYGIVLPDYGVGSGVPIDMWHAPPALLAADELVGLVDAIASYLRIEERELEGDGLN